MYLKSKATPSVVVDLLNDLGICMSFRWISAAVRDHSKAEREDLVKYIEDGGRPMLIYDNIRIQFRKETQRVNNQTHGDNGVSATVVRLPEETNKHLQQYQRLYKAKLEELRGEGKDKYPRLSFADLIDSEAVAYNHECTVYQVIKELLDQPKFESYQYKDHPNLQPPSTVYQLPTGRDSRTRYSMLGTWPIEQATHEGNILALIESLKAMYGGSLTEDIERIIGEGGIPTVGDQLTFSRDDHMKELLSLDANSFDRFSYLNLAFGWFHTEMTLGRSIFENHRGTHSNYGLARDIAQLGIKGLASDNSDPYFHTIDTLLSTELTSRVLALWLTETGSTSLQDIKASINFDSPTSVTKIRDLAERIVATKASTAAITILDGFGSKKDDKVLRRSILLTRDLLLYAQLRSTVRQGDVGHLEYLVPTLAVYFKGTGNSNYARLMLDYVQWSKYEAPQGYR